MSCQRCHGLMVMGEDDFVDMQDGGEQHWLCVWRCLNCGDVIDPIIMQHRLGRKPARTGRVRRSPRISGRQYEVVPLSA